MPTPHKYNPTSSNSAADLIRQKLNSLYRDEPNARVELAEAQASPHRSAHQKFMFELGNSGRSLAEIQTAWHNYYVGLSDAEKHKVWQEFYEEHGRRNSHSYANNTENNLPTTHTTIRKTSKAKNVAELKNQIIHKVSSRTKAKKSSHLKSLFFGLASGGFVVIIMLFGFFNERFIAPFISPSRNFSSSSIIIDPAVTEVGPEPKIIIPKINVEIPVIFDEPSVEEKAIQKALEKGVVYYATTSKPGELGNGAIFGHSSNNILNRGNYKYAFVLLNLLKPGDTFYIQKDSIRYVYKVFDKKVVKPTAVGILEDTGGKESTYSLITCDPPGSSANRLVVLGEQISPDPSSNKASTAIESNELPRILPSNSESLWHRFTSWLRS